MHSQTKKVFVVGGDALVTKMFHSRGWHNTADISNADLVCFTGGADVSPHLYGEKNRGLSMTDERRDAMDYAAFTKAKGKKKVGICRGGQFLNVLGGGKMVQHVEGHGIWGTHKVYDTESGEVIDVTSTHHQQIDPVFHIDYGDPELIAVAEQDNGIEVVYYPKDQSLCFQPHPEYGVKECEDYFFSLLERKLGV